jgi:putative MATE family efflux protein
MPARPGPVTRSLLEGPITPSLLVFSLPLLTTNFMHSLSGTWGAVWVSHVLGPNALTAVVNANVFMFMMMGAVMGVGTAAGIAIGQAHGAGDQTAIRRVVGASVTFVAVVSLVIALVGYIEAPRVLDLMRMPEGARADAKVFLRVTCLSMPTIFTFLFFMMMMRGIGDARTPFRFSLLWIALSLALGPILLTGAFGFPRLGIAGVALGNLIANAISLAALLAYIYGRKLPIALRGADLAFLKPDPALLLMLVRRGAPMALETIIVQGAYFVLLAMVNTHGEATAAAYAGAAQLWGYVQMPAIALAASMSAMAAMNIGADQWDRVETIALRGCMLSVGLTTLTTLLVYGLGDIALKLFLPQGGEALAIARHINYIALWGWIVLSITSGLSAIVRANGAMLAPTIVFLVTMWILRVPFAAGLQPVLGVDAIWWSFPLGSLASAALAWAYFCWGGWRNNRLLV